MSQNSEQQQGNEGGSSSIRKERVETFYIMSTQDISVKENVEKVKELLTTSIGNCIVDVRIIGVTESDTVAGEFLRDLKETSNLVFRGV